MSHRKREELTRPALRVVEGGQAALRLELITEVPRWHAIELQWRRLFAASPSATPPLRWEWLRAWWDVYAPAYSNPEAGLRVITAWSGDELAAALPLYAPRAGGPLSPRSVAAIGTGEQQHEEVLPEYMDLLYREGLGTRVAAIVRDFLLNDWPEAWDEVHLRHLSPDSPLRDWNGEHTYARPNPGTRRTCYVADLSQGFEAYLARLSANERSHSRRLLRDANADGLKLEIAADAANAEHFLEQLASLHQARWQAAGQAGCFGSVRFRAFHQRLVRDLAPEGAAVIARLAGDKGPASLVYGFVERGCFYFYQTGTRLDWPGALRSPGIAAHLLLMRELAERGVGEYDFLCGDAAYKERLATHRRELFDLRLARLSVRSAARAAGLTLGRSVRDLLVRRAA